MHYNRFRYYDSETGQYISADPIGLLGGVNPYGYVANPLSWVDPLGLIAIYEDAPYHGKTDNSVKSRAPTNGQGALDNSTQVKSTSPRRVGVDNATGEFVVLDKTRTLPNGDDIYHGHVRSWNDLHVDQQNALKNTRKVNKKGKCCG